MLDKILYIRSKVIDNRICFKITPAFTIKTTLYDVELTELGTSL